VAVSIIFQHSFSLIILWYLSQAFLCRSGEIVKMLRLLPEETVSTICTQTKSLSMVLPLVLQKKLIYF
jgi:hypothetical protein